MIHFLVVFDRADGRLVLERPYEDRDEAVRARFQEERLRPGSTVEVVVLSAASLADLRRTHARYYQDAGELARAGIAALDEDGA